MKFVSFSYNKIQSLGILDDSMTKIIDIHSLTEGKVPDNMLEYLNNFENNNIILSEHFKNISNESYINFSDVILGPPLSNPVSFRDAYAFRQHVEAGRKNRGLDMIPEYVDFPVFYFSNHNSISGPGDVFIEDNHLKKLDFEFEIAVVICKKGKNIKISDADKYMGGFVILMIGVKEIFSLKK